LGVPKHQHILVLLGGDWNHGILNDFPYIFHILGMSSSQLTFTHSIIFQRGRFFPPTTNQGRFIGAYLGGSVPYRSLNHSSLDDGKMFTGKPSPIFDGKNPWVSGSDFPLNQSND
jgi:hypothetical protein